MFKSKIFSKILLSLLVLLATQNLSAMKAQQEKTTPDLSFMDVLNLTFEALDKNKILYEATDITGFVANFCNTYQTPKLSGKKSKKKKQKSIDIFKENCIPQKDALIFITNFINELTKELTKEKITEQNESGQDGDYSDYTSEDDKDGLIKSIKGAKISGFNSKDSNRNGSPSFSRPGTPRKDW